jgi:hypothetical protein
MSLSRSHRSIGVGHADLPVIGLMDRNLRVLALSGAKSRTEFRDRAYVINDCKQLNKIERQFAGIRCEVGGIPLLDGFPAASRTTSRFLLKNLSGVRRIKGCDRSRVVRIVRIFVELEADQIGLTYIARAGYDPRESVAFWKWMMEASQSAKPPEFMSTHPADQTHINQLEQLMPAALEIYQKAVQR